MDSVLPLNAFSKINGISITATTGRPIALYDIAPVGDILYSALGIAMYFLRVNHVHANEPELVVVLDMLVSIEETKKDAIRMPVTPQTINIPVVLKNCFVFLIFPLHSCLMI